MTNETTITATEAEARRVKLYAPVENARKALEKAIIESLLDYMLKILESKKMTIDKNGLTPKQIAIEKIALIALQVNERQCGITERVITQSLDEIGVQEKTERLEQAEAMIEALGLEVVDDLQDKKIIWGGGTK